MRTYCTYSDGTVYQGAYMYHLLSGKAYFRSEVPSVTRSIMQPDARRGAPLEKELHSPGSSSSVQESQTTELSFTSCSRQLRACGGGGKSSSSTSRLRMVTRSASQSFMPTAKSTASGSSCFGEMDIVIWMYGHGYVKFS